MEDSLKSQPDKEGSKASSPYLILEMSTGLSIAAVPVHASLTEEQVGLNSDQGSMVMGNI
jgi:hypothetical protein